MIRSTPRRQRTARADPVASAKARLEPLDPRYDADEIAALIATGRKAIRYLEQHRAELTSAYPDEWILVGPDGLVAHSKSRASILRATRRKATDSAHLIEFLPTTPQVRRCLHRYHDAV